MKKQSHKIPTKELVLSRETVRRLTPDDLTKAVGGDVTSTVKPSVDICPVAGG